MKLVFFLFILTGCALNNNKNATKDFVGVYINGDYSAQSHFVEILSISKAGAFEQWRSSDAEILDEKHKVGTVAFNNEIIFLKFENGEIEKKYLVRFDNSIVLFREDSFKIWQEKSKVYKLGALINITKKDLDEKTRIEILSIMRELNDFSTGIIKPLPNPNRKIFEPKSPWLGKYKEWPSK